MTEEIWKDELANIILMLKDIESFSFKKIETHYKWNMGKDVYLSSFCILFLNHKRIIDDKGLDTVLNDYDENYDIFDDKFGNLLFFWFVSKKMKIKPKLKRNIDLFKKVEKDYKKLKKKYANISDERLERIKKMYRRTRFG